MMNKTTHTLSINDIGFRVILIPFFGICIPLVTHMIDLKDFTHWQVKMAYLYTIILAFIIWHGNRYLLFSLRSYFSWFNKPVRKILTLLFAVTFFTLPVNSILLVGWYQLFMAGEVNWSVVNTSNLIIMVCVLFITHTYETAFLVKDSESEMLENAKLEKAKAEAELQALKNQIDPHFMFNSLNTLSYLIEEESVKAKEFTETLADVYRYILQNKTRNLVMLREEILFLNDYFSLQKIRHGTAVTLEMNIPVDLMERYMIPPISLQVLAENAFKHNEFSINDPLTVNIFLEKDMVIFSNKIKRKHSLKPSPGVGLLNLRERYELTTGLSMEILIFDNVFAVRLPVLGID